MLGAKARLCDPGQRPPSLGAPARPPSLTGSRSLSRSLLYAQHVPCKPFLCGIRTEGSSGHLSGTGRGREAGWGGQGGAGQRAPPGCAGRGRPAGPMPSLQLHPCTVATVRGRGASFPYPSRASSPCPGTGYGPRPRLPLPSGRHSRQSCCKAGAVTTPGPFVQMGRLRPAEARGFAQDHTARQPKLATPSLCPLPCCWPEGARKRETEGGRGL